MPTHEEITTDIEKFVADINAQNDSDLVVTLGTDDWLIEESEVPLVVINYETGRFDALDAIHAALPLWGLTFTRGWSE